MLSSGLYAGQNLLKDKTVVGVRLQTKELNGTSWKFLFWESFSNLFLYNMLFKYLTYFWFRKYNCPKLKIKTVLIHDPFSRSRTCHIYAILSSFCSVQNCYFGYHQWQSLLTVFSFELREHFMHQTTITSPLDGCLNSHSSNFSKSLYQEHWLKR